MRPVSEIAEYPELYTYRYAEGYSPNPEDLRRGRHIPLSRRSEPLRKEGITRTFPEGYP